MSTLAQCTAGAAKPFQEMLKNPSMLGQLLQAYFSGLKPATFDQALKMPLRHSMWLAVSHLNALPATKHRQKHASEALQSLASAFEAQRMWLEGLTEVHVRLTSGGGGASSSNV